MTDKKRTLSAQMPVNAVLAALAANALSEGTVRWAFPALLAVFCFLIWDSSLSTVRSTAFRMSSSFASARKM